MRYGLRDIPALLRTPVGRRRLYCAAFNALWPALSHAAAFHRRTLARQCRIVAVVGSLGKTTTTRMTAAALGLSHPSAQGRNSRSAIARAVLSIGPGDRYFVQEVGIADFGQMARYAYALKPDVVVVTCIASEHHRSLGTLEATRAEKVRMLRGLSATGLAVLNGDDPHVRWMAGRTRARVVTFGFGAHCLVRADRVALDWPHGTRFRLRTEQGDRHVRIRLLGRHMVYAALAAVAVSLAEGRGLGDILPRIEAVPPTCGRMQAERLPSGAWVLRDDFKSTYETIDAAFDTFGQVPARRRIVALGDVSEPPGSIGPIYRHFGRRIAATASLAVILGTQFQRYAAGAKRAGMPRSRLMKAGRSVLRAAELLRTELREGDVVLVKGRDNQHMERITLLLQGRPVRCSIPVCRRKGYCSDCPMLERGWGDLEPLT